MKLYYISVSLTATDFRIKVHECDCEKTRAGYRVDKQSSFGGKTTLVKNSQILLADSMVREHLVYTLHRFTWCLENDIEKAKNICIESILEKANEQFNTATRLLETIKASNNEK